MSVHGSFSSSQFKSAIDPMALYTTTHTTVYNSSLQPTTIAPTWVAPTPSTSLPTTAAPTLSPTPLHHHHSQKQQVEIDLSVIAGFVVCVLLALMYRKRRRLPDYFLKLKYYLCCCRISIDELVGQQDEHATLNDFIFEVDENDQSARVNMSGLTADVHEDPNNSNNNEGEDGVSMPVEISISSVFPDLLGGETAAAQTNDNDLEEPLIGSTRRNRHTVSNSINNI